MPPEDRFLELLNQLTHAHKVQMDAAFERGRVAGRREARAELREEVKSLRYLLEDDTDEIGEEDEEDVGIAEDAEPDADKGHRAPPGSVKPIISDLIHKRPGLMTADIRAITKLKPNSIRGTLWTLSAQDKAIVRRNGRWYPTWSGDEADAGADRGDAEAQKEEAAGDVSSEDAPTASEPERTVNALFD